MLLAGHHGVTATMWSIQDKVAPQLAKDVYERIMEDGKHRKEEIAYTLHDAVKKLRESERSLHRGFRSSMLVSRKIIICDCNCVLSYISFAILLMQSLMQGPTPWLVA